MVEPLPEPCICGLPFFFIEETENLNVPKKNKFLALYKSNAKRILLKLSKLKKNQKEKKYIVVDIYKNYRQIFINIIREMLTSVLKMFFNNQASQWSIVGMNFTFSVLILYAHIFICYHGRSHRVCSNEPPQLYTLKIRILLTLNPQKFEC